MLAAALRVTSARCRSADLGEAGWATYVCPAPGPSISPGRVPQADVYVGCAEVYLGLLTHAGEDRSPCSGNTKRSETIIQSADGFFQEIYHSIAEHMPQGCAQLKLWSR